MSRVSPAGTVIPLNTIVEHEPFDADAEAASVNVQPEAAVMVPELSALLDVSRATADEDWASEDDTIALDVAAKLELAPEMETGLTTYEEPVPTGALDETGLLEEYDGKPDAVGPPLGQEDAPDPVGPAGKLIPVPVGPTG